MAAQRVAGRAEKRVRGTGSPLGGAIALLRAGPRLTAARVLSVLALALMLVQSLLGLLVPGLYPEQGWAVAALRGNDLVTLAVIVPARAELLPHRNPRLGHVGRRVARPALLRDLQLRLLRLRRRVQRRLPPSRRR